MAGAAPAGRGEVVRVGVRGGGPVVVTWLVRAALEEAARAVGAELRGDGGRACVSLLGVTASARVGGATPGTAASARAVRAPGLLALEGELAGGRAEVAFERGAADGHAARVAAACSSLRSREWRAAVARRGVSWAACAPPSEPWGDYFNTSRRWHGSWERVIAGRLSSETGPEIDRGPAVVRLREGGFAARATSVERRTWRSRAPWLKSSTSVWTVVTKVEVVVPSTSGGVALRDTFSCGGARDAAEAAGMVASQIERDRDARFGAGWDPSVCRPSKARAVAWEVRDAATGRWSASGSSAQPSPNVLPLGGDLFDSHPLVMAFMGVPFIIMRRMASEAAAMDHK